MLKIHALECGYGRMKVLDGVSIEVGAESVGLFGPNGAGKTTLIGAVMGLNKVWGGTIELDGKRVEGTETHLMARMGVALVPQERELFPGMSVDDNLMLGAAYIPHAKGRTAEQLEKVFSLFPILKERRKQLAGTMSGGQQRMVAIARALMSCPKLLILDEPSLGLQPSIVAEVFEVLKELKKTVSILVTEQNVRESLRSIDRGYVLENGKIVIEDSAEGLKTNPYVLKSYLGI
ncbi:MAG: branched-chain amino acid ABC transporter ATP-binding protein [Spirochaetae bacterium HGW-Spirochaetae-9]|nr:MAG: branched-chain amino acid ABC transporter ATP-binding protein [Spirochaetae bacterium HGW-Spirochaetae-9]